MVSYSSSSKQTDYLESPLYGLTTDAALVVAIFMYTLDPPSPQAILQSLQMNAICIALLLS